MPGRPITLLEWQEMFAGIYGEKNARDYASADLLLHIQEEAAKIDEGVRKENISEIKAAVPIFFAWLLSFCNAENLDLTGVIWSKYPAICPYCGAKERCMCITNDTKPDRWLKNPEGKIPENLDQWQEMFRKIYGRINKMAWRLQVWLHVHEELGEFSREFRLKEISKSREELADIFAWLMAFCNKLNISLNKELWQTYPGICFVCKKGKCQCPKV